MVREVLVALNPEAREPKNQGQEFPGFQLTLQISKKL